MSYLHVHQHDVCVFSQYLYVSVFIMYIGHGHITENQAGNV